MGQRIRRKKDRKKGKRNEKEKEIKVKFLSFEPIGMVKMSRSQYWRYKAIKFKKIAYAVSFLAFTLGTAIGFLIGNYM